MLSLRVDSSKYQVLWSEAEGPAVGSVDPVIHRKMRINSEHIQRLNREYEKDNVVINSVL